MSTSIPDELPVFPTSAPAVFADPVAATELLTPVLARLADLVDVPDEQLHRSTPCGQFDVEQLRRHVLAWLQFFAATLDDPTATSPRLDPERWTLPDGTDPRHIVMTSADTIVAAADAGVAAEMVTMSEARMAGDGVLAMTLGEYIVHGWDLAVATDRSYRATDAAAEAALAFLAPIVQPEHRGPDSGFFDEAVPAAPDATALERLLCFAGRTPSWSGRV